MGIMGWVKDWNVGAQTAGEAIRGCRALVGMGALNLVRREQTRDDHDEPREMPLFCSMIPSWDSCRSSVGCPLFWQLASCTSLQQR
jgi:hypothetical protein